MTVVKRALIFQLNIPETMGHLKALFSDLSEKQLQRSWPSDEHLMQALTHGSEKQIDHKLQDYERLEFLGDALLNAWFSVELFRQFPKDRDGTLSKLRASLVSWEKLAELARLIGLWEAEKLTGISRDQTHRRLGSQRLEALVACFYLKSQWEGVDLFLSRLLRCFQQRQGRPFIERQELLNVDVKGQLQEYYQKKFHTHPIYKTLRMWQEGEEARLEVALMHGDVELARTIAPSLKMAQRFLAEEQLTKLGLKGLSGV